MTDSVRKLIYVSPSDIHPNPNNPRRHSSHQIRALAKSIEATGFNAPVLVDRDMQVIAGHGRLEAAKHLALSRIPVFLLDDLTDAQSKAFMIADNQLASLSTWDDAVLANQLKELSELSLDFDLEMTGFELPEIDLRIQGLQDEPADIIDEYALAKGPTVTLPGDVWRLGDHMICCGSALDPTSYASFPDRKIATVFTDPPYNVPVNGHVMGRGKVKHREFAAASGEMTRDQFTGFLSTALMLAKKRCASGALIYCCMDWRHDRELQAAAEAAGLEQINLCVWSKTNGGMGSLYRSRHELVFVYRNGAEQHRNNVQLGKFGRNRTNVWNYPGANVLGGASRKALENHPTPKPVALVADAIQDCTDRGMLVLDPFLGSGTTVLAAERTGRRALGIEIDPIYVDTAIGRWQKLTGGTAHHAEGKSFVDVKTERAAHE